MSILTRKQSSCLPLTWEVSAEERSLTENNPRGWKALTTFLWYVSVLSLWNWPWETVNFLGIGTILTLEGRLSPPGTQEMKLKLSDRRERVGRFLKKAVWERCYTIHFWDTPRTIHVAGSAI